MEREKMAKVEDEADLAWSTSVGSEGVCSREVLVGECIQPRYIVGNNDFSVCAACAAICLPAGVAEPVVKSPLSSFECQMAYVAAQGLGFDALRGSTQKSSDEHQKRLVVEGAYRAACAVQKSASDITKSKILENHLKSGLETRLRHEDPVAIRAALDVLPLDQIRIKAFERIFPDETVARMTKQEIREATTCADGKTPRDAVIYALLQWFKGPHFFRWFNKPDSCVECGAGKTFLQHAGVVGPSEEHEIAGLASRIEVYLCTQCGSRKNRFPRYNNPITLLRTSRRGRCGEFANAFTLVCRAIGFEARYVLDITDHVWTEIWSFEQSRWIHCDPCEKKMDRPLMYAKGWGKKLIAVFAFDRCEIADVTRRYLAPGSVAASSERRYVHFDGLSEADMQHQLDEAERQLCSRSMNDDWVLGLKDRKRTEALEFSRALFPAPTQTDTSATEEGRSTGDAEWIRSRGEDGLPNGSWKHSAESPRLEAVFMLPGVSTLYAKLRSIDGSLESAKILVLDEFLQDDDLENIDGTFRRTCGAWSRLLSLLASRLVEAARGRLTPEATEAEIRRRHLKVCANLKRSNDAESFAKFSSLREANSIVSTFILAPGQSAYIWLAFALGFLPVPPAGDANSEGGGVIRIPSSYYKAKSESQVHASRAYDILRANWPEPTATCASLS